MESLQARQARLNRAGNTVVCGWDSCNEVIARVVSGPAIGPDEIEQPDYSWARMQPNYPRLLCIRPGIAPGDIWRMATHAEDRLSRGKPAQFARPPRRGNDRYGAGKRYGLIPRNLPVTVHCPSCGRPTACEAATLRVSSFFPMISGMNGNHYGSIALSWDYDG